MTSSNAIEQRVDVLDRLAARDAARTAAKTQRQESQRNGFSDADVSSAFLKGFAQQQSSLQAAAAQLIARAQGQGASLLETRQELDSLALQLQNLEQTSSDASAYLPSYEARSTAAALSAIRQELEAARNSLLPKPKFAFARKSRVVASAASSDTQPAPPHVPTTSAKTYLSPGVLPGLHVQRGQHDLHGQEVVLKQADLAGGDYTLSHLTGCSIYLLGTLSALRLLNLQRCRVYAGPVAGCVYVEGVTESTLVLATHQLRVHTSSSTDIYLRVRSNPVIEHCSGLRFAPYGFMYEGCAQQLQEKQLGEDTGLWAAVQDFAWLRATASPNWTILPEAQRQAAEAPGLQLAEEANLDEL